MRRVSVLELPRSGSASAERIQVDSLKDYKGNPLHVDRIRRAVIMPAGLAAVPFAGAAAVLAESCMRPAQLDGLVASCGLESSSCTVRPGRWLCLNDCWAHGYYHWLTEQLPKVLLAEEAGFDGTYVIPSGGPFIRQSLELIGIDGSRLALPDGQCWAVDELYLPKQISGGFLPNHSGLYELLRKTLFDAVKPGPPSRRLYIQRAAPWPRHVVNEDELQDLFTVYGVETVRMEEHDFAAQVRFAAEAEILLGPLGSGMTNCIVMPRGKTLVELFPPGYTISYHGPYVDYLDLRYHMVPSPKGEEERYLHNGNVVAYISVLDLTLRNCLGLPPGRERYAFFDNGWQ